MKIVTVDDVYREQMSKDAMVHRDNLQGDLAERTLILDRYIQDADALLRLFRQAQRDYEETKKERYHHYRYGKTEYNYSERDADKMCLGDAEVILKKAECDRIEADFNMVTEFKDLIKQKYWDIKELKDYEKFRAGE